MTWCIVTYCKWYLLNAAKFSPEYLSNAAKKCNDLVKLGKCFHVSRMLLMKVLTKSF